MESVVMLGCLAVSVVAAVLGFALICVVGALLLIGPSGRSSSWREIRKFFDFSYRSPTLATLRGAVFLLLVAMIFNALSA